MTGGEGVEYRLELQVSQGCSSLRNQLQLKCYYYKDSLEFQACWT